MQSIIAVTSIKEQEQVMRDLKEKLRVEYFTDVSVKIVQSNFNQIDLYHSVGGMRHLAHSYKIVMTPVTMRLEALAGFSPSVNIHAQFLLARLDSMKQEVISYVNNYRKMPHKPKDEAFAKAVNRLFQ